MICAPSVKHEWDGFSTEKINAFWTAVLGILYFHVHALFITLKPKFWPLAFAIFLDSVEILMCVKTVHFMFWFRFPTQALLCYSRQ